ncbi:helix-turn-helix domain-containing protein [Arthrobacter luteolus]
MSHRNARLVPTGRLILVQSVISGRPVARVAKEMGASRPTAHRWVNRHREDSPGLNIASPGQSPARTPPAPV